MDCIKMVVTMNPCECGWHGRPSGHCIDLICSPIHRHRICSHELWTFKPLSQPSLNQFLLATVPVEILAFLPAALHLFGGTPAFLRFYPANVCMDLIAGRACSTIGLILTAALIGLLYVEACRCVSNMWTSVGGVRL